jgi:hypothetical protein
MKFIYSFYPLHPFQPLITYIPFYSNVFQLPEGRMLSYFGIVPEGSLLDVPNAALGAYLETLLFLSIDLFFKY